MDFVINYWFILFCVACVIAIVQGGVIRQFNRPDGTFEVTETENKITCKYIVERRFEDMRDGELITVRIRKFPGMENPEKVDE